MDENVKIIRADPPWRYLYCCKCERETPHREVEDDPYFDRGLECLVCNIVWEASDDLTQDDYLA